MNARTSFHPLARLLHWTMALLILAMLFIGVGMVDTLAPRHQWLLAIHKPLGLAIFLLALIRLGVRLRNRPPALPADMPAWQQFFAHASHWALYALMLAMPLIGWAMLSAGGYPILSGRSWHLPALLPADPTLFAWLRLAHRYVAYLFFLTILGHMAAALYHALIRRDDVFPSMTVGVRPTVVATQEEAAPAAPPPGDAAA
ncbi:cytochrome b [Dyella soli]|uniref:Cytochrome b n=1 Tax=Dyella soli TaxID=522319 RepID=A0A4R0YX18_9GAMM|nr:cytochrome b [Dyella soli]TCI11192.1 cytochrome b [Dyella soli]